MNRTGTPARRREIGFPSPLALLKLAIYLTVPAALWIATNYPSIEEFFEARSLRDRNRAEVRRLETDRARLSEEAAEFRTGDARAVEKAARERHDMVRRGERVILLEPADGEVPETAPEAPAAAESEHAESAEHGETAELPPATGVLD